MTETRKDHTKRFKKSIGHENNNSSKTSLSVSGMLNRLLLKCNFIVFTPLLLVHRIPKKNKCVYFL